MKNNRTKFSGEKYYNEAFRVEYFFENTQKNLVNLVLESKAL